MQLLEDQLEENGELLAQIGGVDVEVAKRVLQKHKGDMARAADAMLEGDRGEAVVWESQHRTTPDPQHSEGRSTAIAPHPSSSVIDLTGDSEEEMSRAIQLSLHDTESPAGTQFKATDRAPHPDWQMVRSNAPVADAPPTTQDRILDDAIQASLQDFNKEATDALLSPPPLTVRQGDRPIALRHTHPEFAHASLVLHALFHVPQIRSTISTLRLPTIDDDTPVDSNDRSMWNLIELFTNLDLAQLSYISEGEAETSLSIPPWDPAIPLASISTTVVKIVNGVIEQHMRAQSEAEEEAERLFSFRHGRVSIGPGNVLERVAPSTDGVQVVMVGYGGENPHNNLVSCMEYNLTSVSNNTIHYEVIIEPSDVLGFQLTRANPHGSSSKSSADPISFPKTIYLDRFLFDKFDLAYHKRDIEQKMRQEIQELTRQRETLTRYNERDTLADLRSTLHYYEHVAEKGDETRQSILERTASQVKDILTMVTSKVEDIDHRLGKLQVEVNTIFDCPELQQFRYDLRSVLMHTGLPGRKQIYSYVQDVQGTWWKTVDTEVIEVPEETVLTDPTGVHLGAGPYLLFYSRHLSDEQLREPLVWPTLFSEAVDDHNKKFVAAMHPELGILLDEVPPSISKEASGDLTQVVAADRDPSNWSMSVD